MNKADGFSHAESLGIPMNLPVRSLIRPAPWKEPLLEVRISIEEPSCRLAQLEAGEIVRVRTKNEFLALARNNA